MKPGIYDISAAAYHADPCDTPSLSSSIAKILFERSPLHAWFAHPKLNPNFVEREYQTNMAMGQVLHKLVLGKGDDIEIVEAKDWRTNAAKEQRDAALEEKRLPCLEHQMERASVIMLAARDQLPDYSDMKAEQTFIADDLGLMLRAMMDLTIVEEERALIVDYKTTEQSAEPRTGAPRLMANMGYDMQQAFYERVLSTLRPELAGKIEFEFWIQEVKNPPYVLSRMQLLEGDVQVARRKVERSVEEFRHCLASKSWPGYAKRVHQAALPGYHNFDFLQQEMET